MTQNGQQWSSVWSDAGPGTLQVMHMLLWFEGLSFELCLDIIQAPGSEQRACACAWK